MKTTIEIREQDIYPGAAIVDTSDFERRLAVRAVVLNDSGQIALLNVTNRGFHKLPGGGLEPGETQLEALDREVLEEVGCHIEVIAELGEVVEYRDTWRQIQNSFCYLAKQKGTLQKNALTPQEQEWGFEPIWVDNVKAAIALLKADTPAGYDGQRMRPRDLAILELARNYLNSQ